MNNATTAADGGKKNKLKIRGVKRSAFAVPYAALSVIDRKSVV